MDACGSLQQHIFDTPLPTSIDHSFTDLFKDASLKNEDFTTSKGYCFMNTESLQLCTEGLGFESFDGIEDLKNEDSNSRLDNSETSMDNVGSGHYYYKKVIRSCIRSFPPPISSLERSGKSSVCFKSYRHDGRFVLQEVRTPKQEYLHASREDGRLRLSFVHDDEDGDEDEILEEGNDDDDDNEGKEVDMIDI